LTLLYKKLVGNQVLNVKLFKCSPTKCYNYTQDYLRIYAHCTSPRYVGFWPTHFDKQINMHAIGKATHCWFLRNQWFQSSLPKLSETNIHSEFRSNYKRGSVVLYFINLESRTYRLELQRITQEKPHTADLYLLQPAMSGNLTST